MEPESTVSVDEVFKGESGPVMQVESAAEGGTSAARPAFVAAVVLRRRRHS